RLAVPRGRGRRALRRAAPGPRSAAGHRLRRRPRRGGRGPGAAGRAGHRRRPQDHRQPRPARLRPPRAALGLLRRALRRRGRPADVSPAAWGKEERGARIFVDYNQTAPHKTVFGAWAVRARPGGQVSTPLRWEEVDELHPDELTLATVPDRLDRLGDAWRDI